MIISASRRTDIPAFYSEWFMNRIRAGYCTVPNPFNIKQISRIGLRRDDVTAIVFWTRNPRPLFPYLDELETAGYLFYFQYTLMANPREIDPKSPPMEQAVRTFRELANRVGAERVVWRYDPIVLSNRTDVQYHIDTYARIAQALAGSTKRSVISLVDDYKKAHKRMNDLAEKDIHVQYSASEISEQTAHLLNSLKQAADSHGYAIQSCAEAINLTPYGIRPGKCIDDELLKTVFSIDIPFTKDKTQREACGCITSRDIGVYDTCTFGCQYCYATKSFDLARRNHAEHDPQSPSLIGHFDVPEAKEDTQTEEPTQLPLF
ncbi:hypothetical protein ANRL4_03158 [Anaerolineae bacterium]|nr:hypothetical protein ANRL4_03158 [Anaerolineae bacterium]